MAGNRSIYVCTFQGSGPRLTYKFYTFTSAGQANLTLHLGQTGNVGPGRPLKYAYTRSMVRKRRQSNLLPTMRWVIIRQIG